jgi:hypothetical protein
METSKIKIDSGLTGIAGEYLVAGELSRRGYVASITLRNTRGIDIVATNKDASKSVGIQVKASSGSQRNWILNKKGEDFYSDTLFYVFVNLKNADERPDFFVVPSKIVANFIKHGHAEWLKTPSKKGVPHRDTAMRQFSDKVGKYLEQWDLLNL